MPASLLDAMRRTPRNTPRSSARRISRSRSKRRVRGRRVSSTFKGQLLVRKLPFDDRVKVGSGSKRRIIDIGLASKWCVAAKVTLKLEFQNETPRARRSPSLRRRATQRGGVVVED